MDASWPRLSEMTMNPPAAKTGMHGDRHFRICMGRASLPCGYDKMTRSQDDRMRLANRSLFILSSQHHSAGAGNGAEGSCEVGRAGVAPTSSAPGSRIERMRTAV